MSAFAQAAQYKKGAQSRLTSSFIKWVTLSHCSHVEVAGGPILGGRERRLLYCKLRAAPRVTKTKRPGWRRW